jgi:hypothetical protein
VAKNRRVVGEPLDEVVGKPAHAVVPLAVRVSLGVAAEPDLESDFGMGNFPRVPEVQPVVQHLYLPAVLDGLIEDAEFVANAIAGGRDLQCGQRVEVAGSETAKTSIAEAGLFFLLKQLVEREAELFHGQPGWLPDVEADQVVAKLWPDEELRREIGHRAAGLRKIGVRGVDPAMKQTIAHGIGQGQVVVVGRGGLGELRLVGEHVLKEVVLDGLDIQPKVNILARRDTRLIGEVLHGGSGILPDNAIPVALLAGANDANRWA